MSRVFLALARVSVHRHLRFAMAMGMMGCVGAIAQIGVRPIDPGVTPPINIGGGGGPGGGGGIIGVPINPINPIIPGGGGAATGPRIVTETGMLAGQSTQATVVVPAQAATAAAPGQTSGPPSAVTTYQWTISGGRLTSDPTKQTVTFTADVAGTVALNVVVVSAGSSQSTSAEVVVLSPALAGAITAPNSARTNGATFTATVPPAQNGDRTYRWSLAGSGGAIAAGQGTSSATIRAGAPGLLEVMCDVTLQRIATVTLRSFVVVSGDGPATTLTINQGAGGGSYPAGSRVDVFAEVPGPGKVFDRWVGDTAILGNAAIAPFLAHTVVTVPSTPATLTATYKTVPEWSATVINNFNPIPQTNPTGTTLAYFVPPGARGIVFLLHENGGSAPGWFSRPEPLTLARDLVGANYGVAALSSANRTSGTWSTGSTPATNPDLATLGAAIDRFAREGLIAPGTPIFLLGMAAGGDAATRFATQLASTAPPRPIKGTVLYCAAGDSAAAVTSRIPQFFAIAAHDDSLGTGGANDARENAQLLTGRGIAATVVNNSASPVSAARLRVLGLTSSTFSPADAQAIWSALKSAAFIDANNYPKSPPPLELLRSALSAAYQPRAADVLSQLAVAYAAQEFYSDANARVINFLNSRLADDRGPAPGRLVNLSTRTSIAYLGDSFTLGFTLSGTQRATVLVRGIGPALRRFGIGDALPALRLDLRRGNAGIASNDGWERAANATDIAAAAASVGAFGLQRGDLDAAVLLTLEPGAYTATISGLNGATGDVLAEVYDISKNGTRLTNLSTLAKVGANGELVTAGLVIAGNNPRTLIVRAVGAGLADLGLGADLLVEDPRVSITTTTGQTIAANNNWTQTNATGDVSLLNAAFSAAGAFPLKPTNGDAALVNALPPGNYTVQAASAPVPPGLARIPSTTGTVLVEIYEIP